MDTPSTTNSITYKAFFGVEGNHTMYLNRNRSNYNNTTAAHAGRTMSSMLVMEVEGQ